MRRWRVGLLIACHRVSNGQRSAWPAGWDCCTRYRTCSQYSWTMPSRSTGRQWAGGAPSRQSRFSLGTPGPRCARRSSILSMPIAGGARRSSRFPLHPELKGAIVREADVLTELTGESIRFSAIAALRSRARHRHAAVYPWKFRKPASPSGILRTPAFFGLVGRTYKHLPARGQLAGKLLPLLGQDVDFDLLESALEECCDAYSLPSCRVHGDFAPWNIRRRSRGAAALIDWEESQDVGLPLQDPFHFLHMQDFLFHCQPKAHFEEIVPFAETLGIEPQPCRKLEIAYLADAYMHCCSRADQQRAEFLRRTLALVIRARPGVTSVSALSPSACDWYRHTGRAPLAGKCSMR